MGTEFLAIGNEDHTVVFQHIPLALLMLLSIHFYLMQVLGSMENALDIEFHCNKPGNKTTELFTCSEVRKI